MLLADPVLAMPRLIVGQMCHNGLVNGDRLHAAASYGMCLMCALSEARHSIETLYQLLLYKTACRHGRWHEPGRHAQSNSSRCWAAKTGQQACQASAETAMSSGTWAPAAWQNAALAKRSVSSRSRR